MFGNVHWPIMIVLEVPQWQWTRHMILANYSYGNVRPFIKYVKHCFILNIPMIFG
jgi:hypothetical protein